MNSKVDVLAVLDETFECCADVGMRDYRHPTVRAAVAELIEAAQAMRLEASRLRGDCIPADTLADFDAALNRVTGA